MPSARREGFTGEGGSGAGADGVQRLPCAAFFGYFLVRTQESNTFVILKQLDKLQFEAVGQGRPEGICDIICGMIAKHIFRGFPKCP